ncbi:MAG: hypothetical protein KJO07_08570, partial [Deltaproteobacteria bacterium]|nr:hypothetical protein [Deltaproteobacteria bacterium]
MRSSAHALRLAVVFAIATVVASSATAGPRARATGTRRAAPTAERHLLRGMRKGARIRPDTFFSRGSRMVVDASSINSVKFKSLQLVPLKEVFSNRKSTFIGFGAPNTYLAVPRRSGDARGPGWSKFAAFMFWRQPARVADTKGRVQGGLLVELRGLPPKARAALRTAMESETGQARISCANSNGRVLEAAGFELRSKTKLSKIVLPSRLDREIWEHGLLYRGKPVDLRFIATYEGTAQEHFGQVIKKQVTAPFRAVKKVLSKSDRKRAPLLEARRLGPAVARVSKSSPQAELRLGRPSKFAAALSAVWGEHPIY